MLNQKALDYIFDVNTKIDAKLSRHFRDMERVYAVIARAAAKCRQWEEEESEHRDRMSTCSHAVRPGA